MNLWLYLMAINVATFALYWLDKHAARQRGAARVPEYVLLVMGLIGGWPGALAAQQVIRHKNKKRSFQLKFWALVLVQIWLICFPPAMLKAVVLRIFA